MRSETLQGEVLGGSGAKTGSGLVRDIFCGKGSAGDL